MTGANRILARPKNSGAGSRQMHRCSELAQSAIVASKGSAGVGLVEIYNLR
jgi:hypothetical protein